MCVSPSVHHVVYIAHYIWVIYEDILTKFAGNIYCYENMSEKKIGYILKHKMTAIADCLKAINMFYKFK